MKCISKRLKRSYLEIEKEEQEMLHAGSDYRFALALLLSFHQLVCVVVKRNQIERSKIKFAPIPLIDFSARLGDVGKVNSGASKDAKLTDMAVTVASRRSKANWRT